MRSVRLVAAMIFGGFAYQIFIGGNIIHAVEQAYWMVLTLVGLWGFDCLKPAKEEEVV